MPATRRSSSPSWRRSRRSRPRSTASTRAGPTFSASRRTSRRRGPNFSPFARRRIGVSCPKYTREIQPPDPLRLVLDRAGRAPDRPVGAATRSLGPPRLPVAFSRERGGLRIAAPPFLRGRRGPSPRGGGGGGGGGRLRRAGKLRAAGFGLAQVRRVVETLRRLDPTRPDVTGARLLVAGRRVLWASSDSELVDLLQGGQLMLVFPVGEAVADVVRAVESLPKESDGGLVEAASVRRHG